MKAVVWEAPAREEADDALAASGNPAEFRRAIDEAVQDVAGGRITPARAGRTRCRQYAVSGFPYSVIYAESDDEIRVYAFAHHRRRPGYWRHRLPAP